MIIALILRHRSQCSGHESWIHTILIESQLKHQSSLGVLDIDDMMIAVC
jgi:hypothetical protein